METRKDSVSIPKELAITSREAVEKLRELGELVRSMAAEQNYMPAIRTQLLIDSLGDIARASRLLGVREDELLLWARGEEDPHPEAARALVDLEHVVARAQMLWAPSAALAWLEGANSYLDGARPIDVLKLRGSAEVIEALDAALAGGY